MHKAHNHSVYALYVVQTHDALNRGIYIMYTAARLRKAFSTRCGCIPLISCKCSSHYPRVSLSLDNFVSESLSTDDQCATWDERGERCVCACRELPSSTIHWEESEVPQWSLPVLRSFNFNASTPIRAGFSGSGILLYRLTEEVACTPVREDLSGIL